MLNHRHVVWRGPAKAREENGSHLPPEKKPSEWQGKAKTARKDTIKTRTKVATPTPPPPAKKKQENAAGHRGEMKREKDGRPTRSAPLRGHVKSHKSRAPGEEK